ncbi:hypothetical protein NL466_30375, partial [Klebsiella pneumoniae]|nr:hypothetical protein [Klebsiella pneumoniae]
EWLRDRYGEGGEDRIELASVATRIPMELYRALSLDELCKLRFASRFMMDQSVEDAFHGEPPLTVFHKITNGMWRWGCGR